MASSVQLEVPDFGSAVLCSLNEQRMQGLYCDVTVRARGQDFRAHRAVLAASSAYFRDIFASTANAEDGSEGPLQVELPPAIQPCSFQQVLTFCYTGRLSLPACEQFLVMYTAGFLQIRGIVERGAELAMAAKVSSPRCDSQTAPQPEDGLSESESSAAETTSQGAPHLYRLTHQPSPPGQGPGQGQGQGPGQGHGRHVQGPGRDGTTPPGAAYQQHPNRHSPPGQTHASRAHAGQSSPAHALAGQQGSGNRLHGLLPRVKLEGGGDAQQAVIQCVPTHKRLYEGPGVQGNVASKAQRNSHGGATASGYAGRGDQDSPGAGSCLQGRDSPAGAGGSAFGLEEGEGEEEGDGEVGDEEEGEEEPYEEGGDEYYGHVYSMMSAAYHSVCERVESLPTARGSRCELSALPPDLLTQIGQRCHPHLYSEGDPGEKLELVSGTGVYITRGQLMNCHLCAGVRHKVLLRRLLAAFFDRTTLANSCGTGIRSSTNDPTRKPLDSRVLNAVKLYCQKFAPNFRESEMNVIAADMCTNARRVRKRWLHSALPDRDIMYHGLLPDLQGCYEGPDGEAEPPDQGGSGGALHSEHAAVVGGGGLPDHASSYDGSDPAVHSYESSGDEARGNLTSGYEGQH
ncbi:nucleus accumbens-associated protein 1-like isoform X2 [Petromyzon marinus]|nr:nucleus accumbens-associated protein 1-like isoform X2 [Petromyzon marinus]XP_032814424.1 nucleus accumbens-associated protein 1-like isoform X2 [Petromyzon marinus]